jgi:hypothetical protein
MRAIWRYTFPAAPGVYPTKMPIGARVLHVREKRNGPTVWAEVDPDADILETRTFRVVATGEEFDGGWSYLGTAHTHDGALVWHVMEELRS